MKVSLDTSIVVEIERRDEGIIDIICLRRTKSFLSGFQSCGIKFLLQMKQIG